MNLSTPKILESLMEFDLDNKKIDLHNFSNIKSLKFTEQTLYLEFHDLLNNQKILLKFEDTVLLELTIPISLNKDLILDSFYRGRHEINGRIYECFNDRKRYYLEFLEDGKIDLLCKEIFINIEG